MSPRPKNSRPTRVSWHRKAGRPVRWWFAAIIVAAMTHPFLAEGRWLMVHLFTLGAVTNSILVWGRHFTERLLRVDVPEEARRVQLARIYLLNGGIVVTIAGKLGDWWPVTTAGATIVGLAVAWHAVSLGRDLVAGRDRPFAVSVAHYVASACLLPVGAAFGALLATPAGHSLHDGLLLAHEAVNLIGFLGLAASGTLITMFPGLWRTRMSPHSHPKASLLTQVTGIAVTTVGALTEVNWAASAGLAIVAAGWIIAAVPWAHNVIAVAKDPRDRLSYPALSVAAAVAWLIGTLIVASVMALDDGFVISALTLPLLIGFGAQLLIGVMSQLLPATIGGGSGPVGAGMAEMDRAGAFRWAIINGGLALWLMPLPSWTKVALSLLVGVAFASYLPLVARATKAQFTALKARTTRGEPIELIRRDTAAAGGVAKTSSTFVATERSTGSRRLGTQTTAALAVLALVTTVSVALSGGAGGSGGITAAADVTPTGETVEITVTARDMAYEPDVIEANPGDRLVITMVNADTQVHDLRLATGQDTGRVAPGESATIELPVVPGDVDGWCTIAGHRQMGMTLVVDAGGSAGGSADESHTGTAPGHATPGALGGVGATPGPDSPTIDPILDAAPDTDVHEITLRASEFTGYAAPGIEQEHWVFNGAPLGPTLRGKVGDEFVVTLINDGSMSHSMDFHAGMVSPDEPMRDIAPGERLEYRFRAEHAGIWLYHCATMPMSHHIAAGMHGAVIIDPPGLPEVDHEVLLVQSEAYWGEAGPDADKVMAETPDAYRFNGYPDQYLAHPIRIRAGESVRFWLLVAGPNKGMSFHIVGTQFHRMYKEGALTLDDGAGGGQALFLGAAQGGYVEARFPEPGTYTFVDHQMVHAEMGARGHVIVE
ncbi:multicopper oxidase domain-containing protein [Corynebacterium freneyi]|uniref:multicopper oxidase domain-containing protein n=1 Tax=Corynebacterium freneyi TaxID=134034 RepID=UPI001EF1632F|nr:multicopper oxidase domain-containing protein [Corynebacterium freneyi]MCG7438531.1 multicopper oxidase domain-containing protein [Corynebacterium freneyi]